MFMTARQFIPNAFKVAVSGVAVKDWVYAFDNIGRDIHKVALIFDGNERAPRSIIHSILQWFGQ